MGLIRNLIFIGITTLTVNCGGKDNRVVLSSESVIPRYVIDKPEACKGKEIHWMNMKELLTSVLKNVEMVYAVFIEPASWVHSFFIHGADFLIHFSVKTKRGDIYDNIRCNANITPSRSLEISTNHVMNLWACGSDEIKVKDMKIPLQCSK